MEAESRQFWLPKLYRMLKFSCNALKSTLTDFPFLLYTFFVISWTQQRLDYLFENVPDSTDLLFWNLLFFWLVWNILAVPVSKPKQMDSPENCPFFFRFSTLRMKKNPGTKMARFQNHNHYTRFFKVWIRALKRFINQNPEISPVLRIESWIKHSIQSTRHVSPRLRFLQ